MAKCEAVTLKTVTWENTVRPTAQAQYTTHDFSVKCALMHRGYLYKAIAQHMNTGVHFASEMVMTQKQVIGNVNGKYKVHNR